MDNYSSSLAVCIDCTKNNQSNLIEQLLSSTSSSKFAPSVEFTDQICVHPMHLETKYYSVDLALCKLQSPTVGSAEFADRVEAVMFHLDSNDDASSSLNVVESWMSFVKHWEPSVQILIFDRVTIEKRNDLLVWCAKNEFELIELNPDDDTLQEAEDCGEIVGVHRVIQVLKAHSWPDLELKDESIENEERTKRLKDLLGDATEFGDFVQSDAVAAPLDEQNDEESNELIRKLTEKLNIVEENRVASGQNSKENRKENADAFFLADKDVGAAFGDAKNADNVSFEDLFATFSDFKATADGLPDDQRKKYAEKVTMAFWRAIGGDDDEEKNLGDSDDEGGS